MMMSLKLVSADFVPSERHKYVLDHLATFTVGKQGQCHMHIRVCNMQPVLLLFTTSLKWVAMVTNLVACIYLHI